MEYLLKTSDLKKAYMGKTVVNKINIDIKKGDIYGFIGRNGAGKTTTMKMIAGLEKPTSGGIELFEDHNLKYGRSKIGTVIEYPCIYPYMTARQNIETQRKLLNMRDKSVVSELLDIVGLGDTGHKKAKNFSLGMKQRLAIALSLVGEPEFLMLDEPINGLDPMGIRDIRDLILKLNKERGITVMISSHILGELVKISTRFGIINKGKLVAQFDAEDLKEKVKEKVKIRVNDAERAFGVLKNIIGVEDCVVESEREISVYDHLDKTGEMSKALAENDIILESIGKEGTDYEEYFIELMGGNEND